MKFFDRLLTIIVTATLTSAAWIVFGSSLLTRAERNGADAGTEAPKAEVPKAEVPKAEASTPRAQGLQDPAPSLSPEAGSSDQAGRSALLIPVKGVSANQLTDTFLQPRAENELRRHEAIDIVAPKGTPVIAAASGRIAQIHNSRAGGRSVYVRSNDRRTLYLYGHLDAYAEGIEEGSVIRAGQALGTVGTTGNAQADSPHLHFAMFQTTADAQWWEPANALNPYPLLGGMKD